MIYLLIVEKLENIFIIKNGNYFETGNDSYNYLEGNVYKINKNEHNMKNVRKIEKMKNVLKMGKE